MALTNYATNNALAVKLYAKKLAHEVAGKTFLRQFMGEGDDSLIQIKPETRKDAGDQITYGLRMLLADDGTVNDDTLEGNEEALTTYSDALLLGQLRHAVRSAGEMSEQRVPFSVRDESMDGLSDWWAERLDTIFFSHGTGNLRNNTTGTGATRAKATHNGFNTITAPSTGRIVWSSVDHTTDETLDSTDPFDTATLDSVVAQAKIVGSNGAPRIRPVKTSSGPKYVCFLHPGQVLSLRQSAGTSGSWFDVQKSAMQGGKIGDNNIYTGLLGEWNNTLLFESSYVQAGVNSTTGAAPANTRRALFCGAQAFTLAFGKKYSFENMNWVEKSFDYGNQLGVSSRNIFGIKKNVYNSDDFATFVISSYSAL